MFERFTDQAREVLALAQEEARLLDHPFLGTEHILLGLVRDGDSVAGHALGALGVHLEPVREKVADRVGPVSTGTVGSPPFTPRAKRVLELSLREALQLGHNYIGPEHMLLGLVRDGEGVAAQVLASLGVRMEAVRQRVVSEVLQGASPTSGAPEAGPGPARAVGARCGRCRAGLSESARYSRIEARPGDETAGEQDPLSITVFYCGRCGTVIGPPAEPVRGPTGPVTALTQRPSLHVGRVREPERRFPDELLGPVALEDIAEEARVELSYRAYEVIEGTVGGAEVRLTGRVGSHRGRVKGVWGGLAVEVNWRLGDNSRTSRPGGIITGRFGEDHLKLKGYFQLSPRYWFEQAEILGDLCGQGLRAEVSAAAGGLGSTSTVVAEGTLGEDTFELFAALSGDSARALVRGSFGGRPVSLDATRDEPSAVRIVGEYAGPLPLLALTVGTVAYFL